MALRLPFHVIILLFIIVVAVSSRPSYNSKATRVKKDVIIALKQFDPKKARRTDQTSNSLGEERNPWGGPKLPQPSYYQRG